jgi:5'-3' exonuclease
MLTSGSTAEALPVPGTLHSESPPQSLSPPDPSVLTSKYVDYVMHRIKMLRHYGVEPYVVFDGDYLPSKLHTESFRSTRRADHLSAGLRFHAAKSHAKATEQFQKCIDISMW